jgi:predicted RNA-binding Zn ribbon-like protein
MPLIHPPADRDGFRFRGGSNAIDICATLQARLSPSPRELLDTPEALARWLLSAGLATSAPKTTAKDLLIARQLREAIYAVAGRFGATETKEARQTLNRIAAGVAAVPCLQADGTVHLAGGASALLVTLAREAVHLFGSETATRIRQCQSSTCTLYFIDTSRKGDRRWCSMSACGNQAKVTEFRRRGKEHAKII